MLYVLPWTRELDDVSAMGEGILEHEESCCSLPLCCCRPPWRAPRTTSPRSTPHRRAPPSRRHATNNTPANCTDKLGVSRVAEVDTTGGGEYGEQYPPKPLLEKGEVVLTFDDGPHPNFTREILDALAAQCTKATFFNVGEMIKKFPDIARQVQAEGHTVGTHTYTHRNLGGPIARSRQAADRKHHQHRSGNAAERRGAVLPLPVSERSPARARLSRQAQHRRLRHRRRFIRLAHAHAREGRWHNVLRRASTRVGGGIILFHDIHPQSAKAIPTVLAYLKEHGYKVVHLVPKSRIETVAMAEPVAEPAPRRRAHRHRRTSRR